MLLALAIFVITLTLVIWQPKILGRKLGIGVSAMGGAAVALATGVISIGDIPIVFDIVWNATLTIVFIIIISLLLDEAGFFRWAALHIAQWGGGHGRALFALVILLGAIVAAFFSNDGAALMLTPIVLSMLLALGFTPAAAFAFVIAAGFIADVASTPLVISNLVNIVVADYFDIGFRDYAAVMLPVNAVAIVAALGVLFVYFRRDIPRRYPTAVLPEPQTAIRDRAVFRTGWFVLALLLFAFLFIEPIGVPISFIVGPAALLLWAVAARGAVIESKKILGDAPWQIVVFSLGMYLVVYGLRNAGLTAQIADGLIWLAQWGETSAIIGTGLIAALLASVMNNMPGVMTLTLAIEEAGLDASMTIAMAYANIIGSDLGPKITPIGSLATLMWLYVLARKGIHITWGQYFRIGIVITPPVLVITLLALAAWYPIVSN